MENPVTDMLEKTGLDDYLTQEAVEEVVPAAKSATHMLHAFRANEGEVTPAVAKGALLASTGTAAYGAYGLATDIAFARRHLVDMLMYDKELPKTFREGKFADMIRAHKEDYIHLKHRSSPGVGSATGEWVGHWKMRNQLSGELQKGGVSLMDAIKEHRVIDRMGMAKSALIAGVGLVGMSFAARHQRALENELESPSVGR